MTSKMSSLRLRGYLTEEALNQPSNQCLDDLIMALDSEKAVVRTYAARWLRTDSTEVLLKLIERLTLEKKLYCKLAIVDTILSYGDQAIKPLINLLGEIGHNQYKELPNKPFKKWNYPLPRDLAARTLIRLGVDVLPVIAEAIPDMNRQALLEAIDVIGFISFYEKSLLSYSHLLYLCGAYSEDSLIVWKLVRAFQSFEPEVIPILEKYLKHKDRAIVLEAERSIQQIRKRHGGNI